MTTQVSQWEPAEEQFFKMFILYKMPTWQELHREEFTNLFQDRNINEEITKYLCLQIFHKISNLIALY